MGTVLAENVAPADSFILKVEFLNEHSLFLSEEAQTIKRICLLAIIIACFSVSQRCLATSSTNSLKQQERNSVSLELEFSPKKATAVQRLVSFLDWEPNAYATGFFVSNRLVITAYHVVSGELNISKRLALGLGRSEELAVRVFTHGCEARVLSFDKDADLALLEVCSMSDGSQSLAFQSTIEKDEKVLLIARPHGKKIVGYGTFNGAYSLNGIEYWSLRMTTRDGFSGSPVYNTHGEIIGVFSGYDWSQNLAIVSRGDRVQKLLEGFLSTDKP